MSRGTMGMRVLVLCLVISLFGYAPQVRAAATCDPPFAGIDDWEIATPESVGMDPAGLCALGAAYDADKGANVHGIVVIRNGMLVFERYYRGMDSPIVGGYGYGATTFDPESLHDLRSISKTITALVLGIAIDRGWVGSVDTPVLSFFPEHADLRTPEKERITLRHLLTMSQGLVWNEFIPWTDPRNNERHLFQSSDPYRYIFEQPVETAPGEKFVYSGGSAALIAAILLKQTGQGLDELAQKHLFDPLGVRSVQWSRQRGDGQPLAYAGLRMRSRDLAKIGQILLDHGRWHGSQVVSAGWVEAATASQIATTALPSVIGYGYQIWRGRSLTDRNGWIQWFAGFGLGGQRLFVVPSLDLVVVVTAGLYTSSQQNWVPLAILDRHILPATGPR